MQLFNSLDSRGNEDDKLIQIAKKYSIKIDQTKNRRTKEKILYDFLATLMSFSNEVAQQGDLYEAAGRLYSAGYYLEEFHPKEARIIFAETNQLYIRHLQHLQQNGDLQEGANLAIRIATIFEEKLHKTTEAHIYLEKAIEIIHQQITFLQEMGNSRELCAKYQTLAMLYTQLKNWDSVIEQATLARDLGKAIPDYSIIVNAYFDLAKTYINLNKVDSAQNLLFEAIEYFQQEVKKYEVSPDLISLAQIYQILKNISRFFYDHLHPHLDEQLTQNQLYKFQSFARKEAGIYIELAHQEVKKNQSNQQIASYYRGAALCYQETRTDLLDGASCYFLAANHYVECKQYEDAAVNYEDAAKIFIELKHWKRAYELHMKAGENALRGNNSELAIVNFMSADVLCDKEPLDRRPVLHLLIKQFLHLASIHQNQQEYFIAGTLFLEAAVYFQKLAHLHGGTALNGSLGTDINSEIQIQNISLSQLIVQIRENYYFAVTKTSGKLRKSSVIYIYSLLALCAAITADHTLLQKAKRFLQQQKNKTSNQYIKIVDYVITTINSMQNASKSSSSFQSKDSFEKMLTNPESRELLLLFNIAQDSIHAPEIK